MEPVLSAVPREELDRRCARLQDTLSELGVDAALILEKSDLYYYTGTVQQGYLHVPVSGRPRFYVFKDFERAKRESELDDIVEVSGTRDVARCILEHTSQLRALGMELDVLPVNQFRQYQKLFAGTELVDISTRIRLQRAVKSSLEISLIEKAAEYSDRVAAKCSMLVQAGMTEVELAGKLEAYARSLGHQGVVRMRMFGGELYWGHLLSGAGGAEPSYLASPTGGEGVSRAVGQGAGFRKIGRNEPILLDYVFAAAGYISDHTRVFSIGSLDPELVDGHQAMLEIQQDAIASFLPGAVTGELYERMVRLADEKGVGDYFMGATDKRIRFTGHGVGLELDEFPFIAKGQELQLAEGMVIALEPKLVIPGKGVVGIENCFLVTDHGLKKFGAYPDDIQVLKR